MSNPVSLAQLVSALQFAEPGMTVEIDTQTGEIITSQQPAEGPGGERAESERLQTVSIAFDELELARRFCERISDPEDRRRLQLALSNAAPMEAFESALYRCAIAHEWYPYRDDELARLAKSWLQTRGIAFTDDISIAE